MTPRLHRLLLLTTLTIGIAAGLWLHHAAAAMPVDAASADNPAVVALSHAAHDSVLTVRLRTPTACTVAITPQWLRAAHAAPSRLRHAAVGQHGTTRLHALLRVYRV